MNERQQRRTGPRALENVDPLARMRAVDDVEPGARGLAHAGGLRLDARRALVALGSKVRLARGAVVLDLERGLIVVAEDFHGALLGRRRYTSGKG